MYLWYFLAFEMKKKTSLNSRENCHVARLPTHLLRFSKIDEYLTVKNLERNTILIFDETCHFPELCSIVEESCSIKVADYIV